MSLKLSDVVGAWQLRSCVLTLKDGTIEKPYGIHPRGVIIYTASGWMSCHMAHEGEDPDAKPGSLKVDYSSYHGPFSIAPDQDRLIHHVWGANVDGMVGVDQPRDCRFEGDIIILSASTPRSDVEVRWQRVADKI